jgi:hypothetical protein
MCSALETQYPYTSVCFVLYVSFICSEDKCAEIDFVFIFMYCGIYTIKVRLEIMID